LKKYGEFAASLESELKPEANGIVFHCLIKLDKLEFMKLNLSTNLSIKDFIHI
jgi:hypothetical protein